MHRPSEITVETIPQDWDETDGVAIVMSDDGAGISQLPPGDPQSALSAEDERQRIIDTILAQEGTCTQFEQAMEACKADVKEARKAWKEQQELMRGMFAELARFDEAHGIERGA